MTDFFLNPMTLTIISLLFGLIGIIVSVLVTLKSRVRIEPCLYYENVREVSKISDTNRKVTVSYKGKEVNQVTTTRLWFWNHGRKPLKREDIPANDQLVLTLKNAVDEKPHGENKKDPEILDFGILKVSRGSLNFKIEPREKSNDMKIDFDYLDYNDGAFYEIQHTGDLRTRIELNGAILGPKRKTKVRFGSGQSNVMLENGTRRKGFVLRYWVTLAIAAAFVVTEVVGIFFIPPGVHSSQVSFRETFPKLAVSVGVDSMTANKLTDKSIELYARGESLLVILGIIGVVLVVLLIISNWSDYRRRYPKCLGMEQ